MDLSKFCQQPPGRLVPVEDGDHAFVPNPLPPNWLVPETLWPLIAEANRYLGILEGVGRNLPNPTILLRPLEDREAIQSSRIEGTYATARELLLFEMSPREPTSEVDRANEWREVHNYRTALQVGATTELPLSLRLMKRLHYVLLADVRGRDRTPGEFRRVQVAMGTNKRFIPPPPQTVPELLADLETYTHRRSKAYDPLIDCFMMHYQFETIHPFVDGNGRVGRLLLALTIQQFCGLTKPWLYMSAYFERFRDEYVERLFNVSTKGDWGGWLEFCIKGTVEQAKDSIQRCDKLLEIKREFASRIEAVGGSVRLTNIVEQIFHSPFVSVSGLAEKLGVYYQTAKADVDRLVRAGILKELRQVYPKTFYAPEIFHVAYEDLGPIETDAET